MRIDLTREEHQQLTKLVAKTYNNNYYDGCVSDVFESMASKVFDAQPTVGDF